MTLFCKSRHRRKGLKNFQEFIFQEWHTIINLEFLSKAHIVSFFNYSSNSDDKRCL